MKEELRQAVLVAMADERLDALVYATFDHPPMRIPPDATDADGHRQPPARATTAVSVRCIGFPAMTVPAGFTADGLPVGLEFMGRAFAEPTLFRLAYAYEQGTHHRKPPQTTPALRGDRAIDDGRSRVRGHRRVRRRRRRACRADAGARRSDPHRRLFSLGDFRLESGVVLPNATARVCDVRHAQRAARQRDSPPVVVRRRTITATTS